MKRFLLVPLVLVTGLAACGGGDDGLSERAKQCLQVLDAAGREFARGDRTAGELDDIVDRVLALPGCSEKELQG